MKRRWPLQCRNWRNLAAKTEPMAHQLKLARRRWRYNGENVRWRQHRRPAAAAIRRRVRRKITASEKKEIV